MGTRNKSAKGRLGVDNSLDLLNPSPVNDRMSAIRSQAEPANLSRKKLR